MAQSFASCNVRRKSQKRKNEKDVIETSQSFTHCNSNHKRKFYILGKIVRSRLSASHLSTQTKILMCKYERRFSFRVIPELIATDDTTLLAYNTEPHSANLKLDTDQGSMLTLAIILFFVGSVIAVANAYYCGKCFAVGQPKEYAHFSPCTFFWTFRWQDQDGCSKKCWENYCLLEVHYFRELYGWQGVGGCLVSYCRKCKVQPCKASAS